jgi:hypothetical protein
VSQERIDQEILDQIRNRVISDDKEAQRLLELYIAVDRMALSLEEDLIDFRGRRPTENARLRELIRDLGPLLRLRQDLRKELRYISRPPYKRRYEEEHEDIRHDGNQRDNPKVANSRGQKLPTAKNRQHRNRVSKRHNKVSDASPS